MNGASDTILEIDRLKDLKLGWDSYDADTIERAARQRAREFVTQLERDVGPRFVPPVVGATADGGVALIWRRHAGRLKVEAFFSAAGEDRYIVIRDRKPVEIGSIKGSEFVSQNITTL